MLGRAETAGACLGAYTTGFVPNAIKFNPAPDKQHNFVVGMQNKKIVEFDINSGEIIQEYNEHLGPINTITYYDEGRRFLTTSDDKAIRCVGGAELGGRSLLSLLLSSVANARAVAGRADSP